LKNCQLVCEFNFDDGNDVVIADLPAASAADVTDVNILRVALIAVVTSRDGIITREDISDGAIAMVLQ
jgi:hypothetical protein